MPVRGRSVRLALLSLTCFLAGATSAQAWSGLGASSAAGPVVAPAPVLSQLARNADRIRVGDTDRITLAAAPTRVTRVAVRPRPAAHPRPAVWLPTGTGMWIHEWPKTMKGHARAIVARARAYGVTTLYLRTGTYKGGFVGAPLLRSLLTATRGTGIRVVPWDFPTLEHPTADARRLAAAARYRPPGRGIPRVLAVAPDIETRAEGAESTAKRVQLYLRTLRKLLPRGTSILSTVPWPSESRRGKFPYGTVARYSNAIMPMTYWYNRSPAGVTSYSVRWLRRYHRPVFPVGQGYDSKLDASFLPHSNQAREVGAFMRTARAARVSHVSLWSWQTAGKAQWHALAVYRHQFPPPRPRPRPPAHHAPRVKAKAPLPPVRLHRLLPG
jgi:hypothetical protein